MKLIRLAICHDFTQQAVIFLLLALCLFALVSFPSHPFNHNGYKTHITHIKKTDIKKPV